jgi:proline dehydrogenase
MGASSITTDARLRDKAMARTLPLLPRGLVRRLSSPYIAGEQLGEAVQVIHALAQEGMSTTLDVLGEAITTREEAIATHDAYLEALDALGLLDDRNLRNVSVKLTALGLAIDEGLCAELVRSIVERAAEVDGFVRIDMEDSPWTDATLALHELLREDGLENVGIVVQAYLKRSAADVAKLAASGARVRVVKGIYVEPEAIAWRDMQQINASYLELSRTLLAAGCHVAFATHDDELIRGGQALVDELGVPKSGYEFQMLLGVREERRDALVAAGHPMRVYVPYGRQWYEYSVRRLRENPRMAGHVAGDIARTLRRRLPTLRATTPA